MQPFYPIIYVRGYAMLPSEISETVSTPYMGFNLGATKIRQSWDKRVQRHIFESPLIRLMKEYGYRDTYANGAEISGPLPARSVVIYRYYEAADPDFGGDEPLRIPDAARGLRDLIRNLRDQVCGDDLELRAQFKVHLVAHSMGGLVCRAFLQNPGISTQVDRDMVAKVFTYATPHNGIEIAGRNVPSVLSLWDLNNFNRREMAKYLGLEGEPARVDSLNGMFDPARFFCLVGTNHRDYGVALGMARWLAGEMSDGLVKIENATVQGAPRAFAHRSHSGPYGVVNSEEGYQNLVRFLFGELRVDGRLEVERLPLPPSVQKAHDKGREVRASYYFESTVTPRGVFSVQLSERRRDTHSAILRSFDELMRPAELGRETPRSPVLFSLFLESSKITVGRTLVFSAELAVSTTGYSIDKKLWLDRHVEGEYLFRDTLVINITAAADGLRVRYILADTQWSEGRGRLAESVDGLRFSIPLSSPKGFKAQLQLDLQPVRQQVPDAVHG
ncbi:MAG TPA: hypothetical protein VL027_07490 [Spongiibacteraceae bacterium]|jgi:pimeloyl-ACP methyl ester carboxylesterase|nr:hypothetical protein [Spongiibacteraceae bacterium]HUH37771.1 hypothetical protein [Spongiibacteraceae bacterium]